MDTIDMTDMIDMTRQASPIAGITTARALAVMLPMALSMALPLGSGVTLAQDASPQAPTSQEPMITQTNGQLLLNFRDTPLDEVLDYLSEAAGLIVIKDASITGRVSVVSRQPLTIAESVQVLSSVLKERGYAAVRVGRTLKIVELSRAKQESIPVYRGNDPQAIEPSDEIRTQIIPIRYAIAERITENVQALLPEYAEVSSNETSNSLIVTDTAANVRRVVEIVKALDTSIAAEAQVRVFHLNFADAQDTARLIEDVFEEDSSGQAQQGGAAAFFARMRGGRGGRGGDDQEDSSEGRIGKKVTAAADERTNAVVVSGSPEVLDVIEEMIVKLDSDPVAKQEVLVYQVMNGTATEMATVLNSLFEDTDSSNSNIPGGRGNQNDRGGGPGGFLSALAQASSGSTSAADLVGQVDVVADEATNTLLILAPEKTHERVLEIVRQLDRPLRQVLIKVLVAEVTHDDGVDLGFEFSASIDSGDGLFNFGNDFGIGDSTGGLSVRLIQGDYTATLRALATEGKLDVLSRPYILTSDNQPAVITVGDEVPIPRNAQITDEGNTNTTVEYRDVGIILNVTPHINPEGLVIMDILPEISSLSGQTVQVSEDFQGVVIAKRSAETRVAIRDRQTIVIGGLMQDRLTETISKVPFFGDIPLVGELFKRRENTKSKTELLIFLTPYVAADDMQLRSLSDGESQAVEALPQAVEPGAYDKHMEGMRRGGVRPENETELQLREQSQSLQGIAPSQPSAEPDIATPTGESP